jgi:PqqD family protein of HPr-rel-A system
MIHDVPPPSRLLLKRWGDEAVVYDTASGDTHYLKPLTLALYQIYRDHPGCASTDLAAKLAEHLDVTITPQLREQADDALASLRGIGLLESA